MRVFIGYDRREVAAFHVLVHSLQKYASRPLVIHPLYRPALVAAGLYRRESNNLESTEFSLTRFLVPYLSDYKGTSLFMDCDMLCQGDVAELFKYADADPVKSCFVVKHCYTPKSTMKMDGQIQSKYPRKNWSSVMLFQNSLCHNLTVNYVNTALPKALHRFQWTSDEHIGELPLEWNWLVGEYKTRLDAKLLHYTLGGPWFQGYRTGPEADLWVAAYESMGVMWRPIS